VSGAPALAQSATITVDATTSGSPLRRVWAYHGFDEVNYTTTEEGEALLATLGAIHTAPAYVRSHFLLNSDDGAPGLKWGSTNVYSEDASGNPIYDFSTVDDIMDTLIATGTRPFVEIGFMPRDLSIQPDPYRNSSATTLDGGCFYPPDDYDRWGDLVRAWVEHTEQRYEAVASTWQWELWNEPDIGYWSGTFDEFARLYDFTEAALHEVLPDADLGGPSVAGAGSAFLRQFLEHCATGTNAVTGTTGTRLDIVTFHAKGGVGFPANQVQMSLGSQLRQHRTGMNAVAAVPAFRETPIVVSEADPDGCAACPISGNPANAYRNSPAYGAYVVAMMKRSLELADQIGVELRGVLTWAFLFPDTPYFAGYRALETNGIHLPVLNAFKLLGSLDGNRIPATSNAAHSLEAVLAGSVREEPDIDVIATRDGARIQILVYHYHDDVVAADPVPVHLEVDLPADFPSHTRVEHLRVDETHGDAYTVWVSQGSPAAPSPAQIDELRVAMEPVQIESPRVDETIDGTFTHDFELPRFGISLLTLTPADGADGTGGAAGSGSSASSPGAGATGCGCRIGAAGRSDAPLPSGFGACAALCLLLAGRRRRAPAAVD
jgi:xylan 1,4-beta-xylosidase